MADWFWFIAFLSIVVIFFYDRHLSYKHGVWDGAFNQFLPHVKKAMREYDSFRAEQILGKEEVDG